MRKLEKDDIETTFEYSIRTFERDKSDIMTLFGIDIHYNRKDKVYSIDEDEIEDTSSPSTHYQHLISPLGWCISHKH